MTEENGEGHSHTDPEAQVDATPGLADVLDARRDERHVVVLQHLPGPDGIASAFTHQIISQQYDIDVDILFDGRLTHPENTALVKLLSLDLQRYTDSVELGNYDGAVLVDFNAAPDGNLIAALKEQDLPWLIAVGHHDIDEKLQLEFRDIRQVGATATIYTSYLMSGLLEMDKSRKEHTLMATALMHGIIAETNDFVRAGAEDFKAAAFLSRYRDPDLLEQVLTQTRSRQTMETIRRALSERLIVESYSIAGIGYVRADDRDAIPQAADFLLTEENVHTAIVYGIVTKDDQQEVLVGSMRTSRITVAPDEFIEDVFGPGALGDYFGSVRAMAGTLEIPIGFLSGGRDETYRQQKWQVYNDQIQRKIFGKIGVDRESN